MSTHCSSCGAPIIWAKSKAGKAMPVDAEPVRDGNVMLEQHGLRVTAVVTGESMLPGVQTLYKSHFATCPNADAHRKRRTRVEGTK